MDTFWNSRVKNIVPYTAGEQPRDRQFIKLNTNENPYPPPPQVFAAIKAAANDRLRLYPDPACDELREAIAKLHAARKEQVFVGNGSDEVLAFAFGAFFEGSGLEPFNSIEHIIFPEISYSFYPVFAQLWNIPYTMMPLGLDWTVEPGDYLIHAGGVVLAHPNAPTGIAMKAVDMLAIADFHAAQQNVVIIDEAYADFADESMIPYINDNFAEHKNLLIVRTLSKSHALAGLRVGYAIGSPDLITALERMRDSFNSYTLDRVAQAAGTAAIRCKRYYDEIKRKVCLTRDEVSAKLTESGFTVLPSSANFLFIKHPSLGGKEFFGLLRDKGILTRHFDKDKIRDFIRVTIGTEEDMDTFLTVCVPEHKRNV